MVIGTSSSDVTHRELMQRLRKSDFILKSEMAELNQNKKSNNQSKLIFDWKHSSILNCYTKSIGKFPKKVAHASFLQCSTYIVLGQDDDLGKINLKTLWNHRVRRIR